ncbi:hypothetical protein DOY81_003229 [Sarcophaga bullata]|nr:hypothetical protein DOY81_003229 [Sarcophaga bullata]
MLAIKECLIREGVLNLNPPVNPSNCNTNTHPLQYDVNSPYNLYRNRYSFGSNLNMLNSPQMYIYVCVLCNCVLFTAASKCRDRIEYNCEIIAEHQCYFDTDRTCFKHFKTNCEMEISACKYGKESTTDISVNDLSSANSATAKTSCQQQQQQEPLTKPTQTRKLPKRYQGHHPHFHHHTAPAYYTDLHLKIHTPEAKDSVNENYQSVYRTPSKLIKDEHQFPKTPTATLAAPLPLSPTQKLAKEGEKLEKSGSFFRGAPPNQHEERQQQSRNDCSYMPSSSVLLKPTKGNSSSPCDFIVNAENLPLTAPADGSVVFACTNFKPCVTAEQPPPVVTTNRSRNSQRFASRKRAVRVRSESRPISALYDIICKEKGLDIATTTTNDEDSSASHSREEEKSSIPRTRRSHSRSASRPTKSSLNTTNMSGGLGNNNSSGGDQPQHRSLLPQKKRHDKYSPNTICINDLSDDDEDDETNRLEGGCSRKNFRLRNSHKKGNLWDELEQAKSSSLPPGLVNVENQHNSHDSLNVKPESLVSVKQSAPPPPLSPPTASSLSNPSLSSSTALSVEPIHMHLSSRSLQDTQSQLQSQPQPEERVLAASPKTDRYTRKHRRLRDEKPRRHTDGAIKLYPSQLNDNEDYDSEVDDVHRNNGSSNHPPDHTSSSLLYHHDLNGAGHDFHNLSANTANAKRYITRSQRTNESRSSPAIVAPLTEQETVTATSQPNQQQEIQTNSNTETTTQTTTTSRSPSATTATTTFETNGHTIKTNGEKNTIITATAITTTSSDREPVEDENKEIMTNNSGKKSKTTTATAAAAAATTATNAKELKLISDDDTTTKSSSITSNMAAAATTNAAAVCSSTTEFQHVLVTNHHYLTLLFKNLSRLPKFKFGAHVCSGTVSLDMAQALLPLPAQQMSVLQHKLLDHHHHHHHHHQHHHHQHHHQMQQNQLNKINVNNKSNILNGNNNSNNNNHNNNLKNLNLNNLNNNHNNNHNNNNNYATPTASSVLKQQRKQNTLTNCNSSTAIPATPAKYRKCPLSPLIITTNTNAPLFSHNLQLSSPSQHLTMALSTHLHSPAGSPVMGGCSILSPLSPNSTSTCSSSVHLVRTTKTTRLRAAALDKKKDEEKLQLQQHRYTSPTSPKPPHYAYQHIKRASPASSPEQNQKNSSGGGSESEHFKITNSANSSPTHRANKKLVPSVSVSMKQNLSETQCTASRSNSLRSNNHSPKSPKLKSPQTTECTVKITASPKSKTKSSSSTSNSPKSNQLNYNEDDLDDDFMEINELPLTDDGSPASRPRCSTMYTETERSKSLLSNGGQSEAKLLELSPVHKSRTSNRSPRRNEERDKSSKRKSNLNRALNEEATPDGDDSAMRRRRRREMGMSRPLVPSDDNAVKALISPHKTRVPSPTKPAIRNDLSYHMEMARRGLDLATTSDRRRAQTASPKTAKDSPSQKAINAPRFSKRSDTVAIGDLRKERSSELNRKLNERTRTGLEEIMKIVENASDDSGKPNNPCNPINDLTETMSRLSTSQEREKDIEKEPNLESLKTLASHSEDPRRPSPIKHATFVQEECRYYEPDPLEHIENANSSGMLRSLRMLKAKSIERETAASEPAKLSPILRRKSTDCPPNNSVSGAAIVSATPNHIVSILKKKDHLSAGESSSASSNASPVTFSSNVMDTPSKHKRAGILKKRSSLDESRYYSRSHSPDERSILIKSARRNSLEEVANGSSSSSSAQGTSHHGILKQSSYDSSKSDGCPSATREPHSILKKKDSTSTPSDGGDHAPKHVSISQAVILAAAELSAANENGDSYPNDELNYTPNNEEYDIKPILKLDSFKSDEPLKQPKPILKKKSSGDSDEHEIRPILKTSRKSSREEFEFSAYSDGEIQQEPSVRPILKTDSPSKRRSLGEPDSSNAEGEQREKLSPFMLKRRTRSLERQDQSPVIDLAAALNAIATSQDLPSELVSSLTNTTAGTNISVAERIKSVEKFLANQSGGVRSSTGDSSTTTNPPASAAVNTSWESPLQNDDSASCGVKILKPSVIRRDLYKDRFKTLPVTSDEKNFFKNNVSSTLHDDNSLNSVGGGGASAFKPAQSLEGLGFAHLSSHGYQSPNAPPSAFTLTRSFTQPLSSSLQTPPLLSSSFKTGVPVPLPRKSPPRSSRLCANDTDNLTLSFTGDSSFSCNNTNSERIFEMSSLDQDIEMNENQEPQTPQMKETSEAPPSGSTGVVRTNSVRARANMFQQLQEKTNSGAGLNREERTSPKRVPRRLSPSPAVYADEPKTPNNPTSNPDDEIEPSSLPLSERLRFFSNLSGSSSKRNSCSFTRSPPFNSIERSSSIGSYHYYMANTPRSSTSLSSASVTPTPTECHLPLFIESPMVLKKEGSSSTSAEATNEVVNPEADLTDSRFAIKPDIVKTSPFLQASKPISAIQGHLGETETTPTSTLTPTMKRIKLKTVGKLMLPSTFLNNDRNNNSPKEPLSCVSTTSSTGDSINGMDNNENSGPPKKIGKIKSPFIENCNQKQQKLMLNSSRGMKFDYNSKTTNSLMALSSVENSADHHSMDTSAGGVVMRKCFNNSMQINGHHHSFNEDLNTDSGKENVDTSLKEQTTPVVEIRRKFTRKANTSHSLNTSSTGITRQLTPRSASLNGPYTPSPVNDKYAKYFGVKSAKSPPSSKQQQQEQHTVQDFGMQAENSTASPFPSQAVNRNVRLWHSTGRGIKRMASVINELKKFEDIVVTERELKLASKEFENLLSNETILKHSSKELDRIFSSIV